MWVCKSGCLSPCQWSSISPLINTWMWNLTCGACHPGPHPQSLSVCLMDAGSGSLMEAAPCGRAAAGRLKLQVERVKGCSRRSYSVRPYCSKKNKRKAEAPCRHFDLSLSNSDEKRNSSWLFHCPSVSKHWMICNTCSWKHSQIAPEPTCPLIAFAITCYF